MMSQRKGLLSHLGEALDRYRAERRAAEQEDSAGKGPSWLRRLGRYLVPNIGTLILVTVLLFAVPSIAAPLRAPNAASTSTISYQGRLADALGNPLTGYYNLEFRIYDVPSGGVPLWEELWTGANSVAVSDGLFNVMLGSLSPGLAAAIEGHDELYLGITVGTDSEMVPRVQLGSVPFAFQALTIPDTSVTTAKIVDGAVTSAKLNLDSGLNIPGDLTATGRVGVGTQNPDYKLTIVQDNDSFKIDGNGGLADMALSNTRASVSAEIGLGWPNAGTDNLYFARRGAGDVIAMVLDPNGNVGIGTTSPGATLHVVGSFVVDGAKSAVVNTAHYGQRKLYALESPDVRFADEGLAQLKNGGARVKLDPIFIETIEGEYLVQVTPYGNASLYVAEISRDYFVVKVREGNPNVAFAWRLSAHRKGYANVRLEELNTEVPKSQEDMGLQARPH